MFASCQLSYAPSNTNIFEERKGKTLLAKMHTFGFSGWLDMQPECNEAFEA